jgi:hypothetical protein
MSHFISNPQLSRVQSSAKTGAPYLLGVLKDTFICGPRVLFTSRIDGKCAAAMAMMCSPALLFALIHTIPAILFQSPQQNAYFYFSGMLEQDSSRWYVLVAAGVCAILSLSMPATMPDSDSSVDS